MKKKIKIALNDYPFFFSPAVGPNIFLQRLLKEFKNLDCDITSKYNPLYDVGLFATHNKSFFNKPYALRIGGIFFDKKNTITSTYKANKKIFKDIKDSHGVIFVCEFTKALTEKLFGEIKKPNIVIQNSVSTNQFKPTGENKREELKINKDEFVIVVSATWRRHKRLKEIIIFFEKLSKKLDNITLIVLGNINEKLENLPNKVILVGKVNYNDLPSWYRTGNIYLHFAWIDHGPNTHIEATACGLPSLSTNNGGAPEIIQNCNSGIVSYSDQEYKFELVDLYNPPEPDYDILERDFMKIYNNYNSFKKGIDFSPVSIDLAAKKYLQFLTLLVKN